ncbi:MAG: hypothetical protein Q9223_007648 [Gallowayella weberi]
MARESDPSGTQGIPHTQPGREEEDWSDWSVGGPQLIKSCGQKKYCCQPSGNKTSCCDKHDPFELDEAKLLTVIPQNPERASTSKSSTQSSSSTTFPSSTSSTPSTPTTAATSTVTAPASPAVSPSAAATPKSNDSTNKGLAAGLGIVLGLALIGGLLFGLYKWDQKRQAKKQAQSLKRSSAPNEILPPAPLVENEGHMQWGMATAGNVHEAPPQPQTPRTPGTRFGA